jgi:hypothetical protein
MNGDRNPRGNDAATNSASIDFYKVFIGQVGGTGHGAYMKAIFFGFVVSFTSFLLHAATTLQCF